jgi:sulfonate transport system permease protein
VSGGVLQTGRARWRRQLDNIGLGLALPISVAVLWQAAVALGLIDPTLWASPVLVTQAFLQQIQDPQFWSDFGTSLLRDIEGTAIGIAAGLPLGLILGLSRFTRDLFAPFLDATKAIPIFTWVPLLAVWVGSGEEGKITFIALAAAIPILFSSIEGVFSLDMLHLELARLLRLGRFTRLFRLVLPGAAPAILRGVRLSLLFGWLATIGAEYLFEAGGGIGTNIMGARQLYRLDLVVVDMIAIGLIGILFDSLANGLDRYFLRWTGAKS